MGLRDHLPFASVRSNQIENEQACTEDALETSVVSNFKTLSDRLAPPSNTNTILFHVDEGHQLQRGVTISALRSVFTVLETRIPEHLVVLTSTASELIEPAPSTDAWHVQSSDRFPQRTKNGLIQPWCYLPVNVDLHAASFEMPEFNESDTFEQEVDKSRKARAHLPKTPTARVVRSFQHQIMIGRPL